MTTHSHARTTRHTKTQDLGLLLGRVVLGVVFLAHGLQKWTDGIGGTQEGFAGMGVPLADVSAVAMATLEVAGGIALIIGFATSVAGALLGLGMLGAAWYAHRDAFFVADGGAEFVLVLAAGAFLLALTGAGRLSVDALLRRRSAA